eukprot:TRINITY_DN22851_c0_g1_i1.p1 TRINITY_DN22851_c0_g1~~TRINITY_DN22851_c0_g1_i1.p1  ORF type:complete len:106 (+),score=12.61 TRINITY_DN22851_c0_g1_i1:49-366(+)
MESLMKLLQPIARRVRKRSPVFKETPSLGSFIDKNQAIIFIATYALVSCYSYSNFLVAQSLQFRDIDDEVSRAKSELLQAKIGAWDSMESHNESTRSMRKAMSSK